MRKNEFDGKYLYCYYTKSSHFSFVTKEALKNDIHLEISSAYVPQVIEKISPVGVGSNKGYWRKRPWLRSIFFITDID